MPEFTVNIFCLLLFLMLFFGIIILLIRRILYFKNLSNTDQMTSLLNYSGLILKVEKLVKTKTSFSLSFFDIDDFGKFNKISYKLGDDVLKEFALFLKKSLPEDALLGRFRIGDEFVIIFKNADLNKTKLFIEKFKEKLKQYKFFSLNNFPVQTITFSEGVVEMNYENKNIDSLFSEAENGLKINKLKFHKSV